MLLVIRPSSLEKSIERDAGESSQTMKDERLTSDFQVIYTRSSAIPGRREMAGIQSAYYSPVRNSLHETDWRSYQDSLINFADLYYLSQKQAISTPGIADKITAGLGNQR